MTLARTFIRLASLVITVNAACSGTQAAPKTPGCVPPTATSAVTRIALHETASVPQPCPERAATHIVGPARLTVADDGLQVQFEVADASFVQGTYRETSGQRDVVVVFPSGEGPGLPAVELALVATPNGYRVDDVLPWETWGLHQPDGTFHFVCAVFDREVGGAENEIRISMHIRVRPQPADAGVVVAAAAATVIAAPLRTLPHADASTGSAAADASSAAQSDAADVLRADDAGIVRRTP